MYEPLYYLLAGSATFLGLVFGLSTLAFVVPPTAYYARLVLSFLLLSACALYGVFGAIVLRAVGYGGLSQWTVARAFKWTMGLTTGVWFDVQGEQHLTTRPAVFVGNHQTELDVLMLGAVFPKYCSVTAKKQLKWWPFLGWFMAMSKTVFIDRGNRESAHRAFDGAALTIQREKQSVYIFPEGTRSYATKAELLPFKKGAFHLAIQAQVPIVPIVVATYSHVLMSREKRFVPGHIPVKVLPPISTKGMTSADAGRLTEMTRTKMLDELVLLTQSVQKKSTATRSTNNALKATGVDGLR